MTIFLRRVARLLCAAWFVLGAAPSLFAQETGEIRGIVTDAADSSPIIGASVFLPDLKLGATTNLNGELVIRKVPASAYSIVARYVGYKPQTKQVTVTAGAIGERRVQSRAK